MTYLMPPKLYQELKYNENGNCETYQEHITIIMEDKLKPHQKEEILNSVDPNVALMKLTYWGINYSHINPEED